MPTKKSLVGTSVSGAHIGGDASQRLAAMIKDDDLAQAVPVLTVGTEDSNAIPVAIQLKDADGKNLASARRLLCQVFDADFEPGIEAELTSAETGAGTEVSTTAKATLLIDTDENGAAEVTVTDVSAALTATVYLKVSPVNGLGAPGLVGLTFA